MAHPLRNWAWLAIALAIVVLIEWSLVAPPSLQVAASVPEDSWKLPVVGRSDPARAAGVLEALSPWGKLPEPVAQQAPDWRFIGVFGAGKDRYVMVKVEGQPEQRLGVGDPLPAGRLRGGESLPESTIAEIGDDSLVIQSAEQRRTLPIYPQGRTAQ